MLLDLRGFRGEIDEVARVFAPEAFSLVDEDFKVMAPVDFRAHVSKDAQKVRLTGRVKTTLETGCGRCLEPFQIPVDAPFDLMFLPEIEPGPDGEKEIENDDVGVSHYKDDVIDLGEVMREQFYSRAADEALVPAGLQGALSDLRRQPQPAVMRVPRRVGGPAAGRIEESAEAIVRTKTDQRCRIPNADTRRHAPPSAGRTTP